VEEDHDRYQASRVNLFTVVVIVGTLLAVLRVAIAGSVLHLSYPYDSFLYIRYDRFNDFLLTVRDVGMFARNAANMVIAYTPVQHLGFQLFAWIDPYVALSLTIGIFAIASGWMYFRFFTLPSWSIPSRTVRAIGLFLGSYPVLFAVDRGNTEMFVFVAVLGFFYFYAIDYNEPMWIIALTIAICLKIYPAVLLLVPLSDRRIRDTLVTVGVTLAATLNSILVLGFLTHRPAGNVFAAAQATLSEGHGAADKLGALAVQHGHSLWGAILTMQKLVGVQPQVGALSTPYAVFSLLVAAGIGAWVIWGGRPLWERFALCIIPMVLLPYSSHDYTLLHAVLIAAAILALSQRTRFDRIYLVLVALLMVPLDYYYLPYPFSLELMGKGQLWGLVSSSVLLYPAILCVLAGLIVAEGVLDQRATESPALGDN
jgi:hypothetical protein